MPKAPDTMSHIPVRNNHVRRNNSQEDAHGAVIRREKQMDKKIHIPARRVSLNPQGVIKITPEAFEALAEVMNETGMSARQAASTIITQAVNNDLIVYDREE